MEIIEDRMHTRVSIVIPCFNTEHFIAEAIQSALSQTRPISEIVVVDDGSTDGSLDVIRTFSGNTIVSQPNGGLPAARNAGIAHTTGDYILFLDADDRLEPEAVALHLSAFEKNPNAPMVYGSIHLIDSEGRRIGESLQTPERIDWRKVLFGHTPSSSQAMFDRESLRRIGNFDIRVRIGEDFPIYLRLGKSADIVCHGKFVADYRKHPGQLTKRPAALLESTLLSQRAFRATFDEETQANRIWRDAERHWRIYWGQWIPIEVVKSGWRRDWARMRASLSTYVHHMPHTLVGSARYAAARMLGHA
jgi:glycosyltransferase involved in cell wall biosynthesis